MALLQYTSNEMFSSTELIRKSKQIFDKLNKDEIEKAIILRDGKPSFMLLDFNKYETIISEYLLLKEQIQNKKNKIVKEENSNTEVNKIEKIENDVINEKDLQDALAKIEQLDNELNITTNQTSLDKAEALKEFWD